MTQFNYTALNEEGREIKSQIEANSLNEAISKIRQDGFFPVAIVSTQEQGIKGNFLYFFFERLNIFKLKTKKINQQELVVFTRQLSVLLDAGLPLVRCLNTLKKQSRFKALSEMISDIVSMIESGHTFSDALAYYPTSFTKVYVNIVKAGEAGGALDIVLRRLADFLEKDLRLKQRIYAALVYPLLVLFIAVGILSFIITFVIPRFMTLFKDIGISLPFLTLILLKLSNFFRGQWYISLGIIIILIICYRFLVRKKRFRYLKDRIKLKLPVLGNLFQKMSAAYFARTLSTLISGGVPILLSLELTKEVSNNEVVAELVDAVHDSVKEGGFVAKVLESSEVFPQLMVNMIAVGEESGSLDKMLAKVADTYEEEVELATNTLAALLEPILIISMGVIVGFIVLAMFLPLINLIQSLTK